MHVDLDQTARMAMRVHGGHGCAVWVYLHPCEPYSLAVRHNERGRIEASGKLTHVDYKDALVPRLEALFDRHGTLRILFRMTPGFKGWDLGAAWDDAALGLSHRADFERIALVGGPEWVATCTNLFGFLLKGEIRTFRDEQLVQAWAWLEG